MKRRLNLRGFGGGYRMLSRRDVNLAAALGLLGTPLLAEAQAAQRLAVVGVLTFGTTRGSTFATVAQGLSELGFAEGKNFVFEIRFGGGKSAAFPGFAAELVALKQSRPKGNAAFVDRLLTHS